MEDDDFGDLYGDQVPNSSSIEGGSLQKACPSYAFYEDEDDEDDSKLLRTVSRSEPNLLHNQSRQDQKNLNSHHHHNHQQHHDHHHIRDDASKTKPADRDSDEDDDLLLLGYNFKSASTTTKPVSSVQNLQAAVVCSDLSESNGDNSQNGGISSPKGSIMPYGLNEVPKQNIKMSHTRMGDPSQSPDVGDVTNHAITIPGLSSTINASSISLRDSGDVVGDVWDQKDSGNVVAQKDAPVEGAEDWDTDESEDDLQIVLNTEYPYYPGNEKAQTNTVEGGSDDEDEDLIIVARNDEGDTQLPEAQITPADGSVPVTGEKQVPFVDEKEQPEAMALGTAASAHPVSRVGFAYHNYNSPYKYVRPGAGPLYGVGVAPPGPAPGGRGLAVKGVSGRVEWRGVGRGSFGPQAPSQTSTWSQSSFEFTLPPSMTVFDIDLEAFEEKPWRQPSADVTDFFNFGFDETSWKDYCRQLGQLRLESTMQSKIKVYESGRSEQEYDPDLPPELAVAAGLQEAGDRNQHRVTESEAMTTAMGRRGHTPIIPLGRPIEVEGGLGDRRPSSDLRKQRIRDSDSIILVDAVVEEIPEQQTTDAKSKEQILGCDADKEDQMIEDEDEELEEQDEEEDHTPMTNRNTFKARLQQSSWHKEEIDALKAQAPKSGNVLITENLQKTTDGRSKIGLNSDQAIQARPLTVKPSATESGKFSGESFSASQREASSRARSGYKFQVDGRKDFNQSPVAEESNQKGKHIHGEESNRMLDGCADSSLKRNLNVSGDNLTQENIPEELQPDSPVCSLKRHRLASPEGSHTASWDNYDTRKLKKDALLCKDSRDSGDSIRSGREEYRKKYKSFSDINKGDPHKDTVEKVEFYHKKQTYMPKRHELETEMHSQSDNTQENRKRQKASDAEMKDLRHSREREEDTYVTSKGRDTSKKDYIDKDASLQFKEKIGIRVETSRKKDDEERDTRTLVSKSKRKEEEEERELAYHKSNRSEGRKREEEERRDRQDIRKRDLDEKRERIDKGYQPRGKDIDQPRGKEADIYRGKEVDSHRGKESELQRGKDIESSSWRNLDRRKREDESRRRDWSEEIGSGDKKEKEKHPSEKHERDADQRERKRDDNSWKRERIQEYHKSKAHDGSIRERESRQTNGEYQDIHVRTSKDDDKGSLAGKSSRRHDEDRSWRGRDDGHANETIKSIDSKSYTKDKRKDLDDYGKEKTRMYDVRDRTLSDRDKEGFNRSESRDRDSGKHGKVSDDLKTQERRTHSDKHKSDAKRSKESEKDVIEPSPQLGEFSSRKRKTADKNELMKRKDSTMSDSQNRNLPNAMKDEMNVSVAGKLGNKDRHYTGSSDDDERQKGRSKLERWMSHKDPDYEAAEKLTSARKEEKQRQSSTSRGKLRHDQNLDKKSEEMFCLEQANGRSLITDERAAKHTITDSQDKKERLERDQRDSVPAELNMAAKLEKRKERFRVSVEDNELSKKLDYEDHQSVERDESRQERPPRKRRWASG